MRRILLAVLGIGLACTGPSNEVTQEPLAAPRLLDGLGSYKHPITTPSPLAQRYFNQGLILAFGFNHEAATASFEYALSQDPRCAMCAWGIAYALGPNINAPMGPDAGRRAHAAAQQALALAERASEREQAYIQAMVVRYAAEPPTDRSALDRAYADAMRSVYQEDPSDNDGAVLFAEALMDLSPWNYWTTPDLQPREFTLELLDVLEDVLDSEPDHVGANHFYIHAVELPFPERGVPAAERLHRLAPDAGHLVHMPSHIFWRVGRYDDALEINRRAVASDEKFFATCRPGPWYRSAYYAHNLHFLWAAAAAEGRSEIALTTARQLEAAARPGLAEYPFLEEMLTVPTLTLVRFGRWDAVLGIEQPDPELVYLTGIWHYARGLAFVRTGKLSEGRAELTALSALVESALAQELMLSGGVASAAQLLAIGRAQLEGELAAVEGDVPAAIASLEDAVERQDAVPYMEPPPWYFPTRQALGAVLLEAKRGEAAERVYRTDLEKYPHNGWSLYGLASSLRAQGKRAEADWAQQGFTNAWARADVPLTASRF
jgi:tetratricopeptide (TPR) repeat protein